MSSELEHLRILIETDMATDGDIERFLQLEEEQLQD